MSSGRRQIGEHLADLVPTRSVLVRLVGAGRRIQRAYDEALAPFDISLDQCRALDALRRAGSQGLDAEAFHSVLRAVGPTSAERARLENEGWLKLDRDGKRTITSQGRQLIADLDPTLEAVEDRLAEELGADELAELKRIIEKIVD